MEEGELVGLFPTLVVGQDGLAELSHGGLGVDGQRAEPEVAHHDAAAVEHHADAGQRAARHLIRCQQAASVEAHLLGDIDLHHAEVGLHKRVVGAAHRAVALEAALQHVVEELVGGAEVGPLRAGAHLLLAAARGVGLRRSFAHDGSEFGLAVDVFADLSTDFGVYTRYSCHSSKNFRRYTIKFINCIRW